MKFKSLKQHHREVRKEHPESLKLRVHRALSWLKAAEECNQIDQKLLLLWISFNAVYAQEDEENLSLGEREKFKEFLGKLVRLDKENLIHGIVWKNYSGKIRLFIDNPYVTRWFWDYRNGRMTEKDWERKFEQSKRDAMRTLATRNTVVFLGILFDRLYVLRNQLMHGGATWKSSTNRTQVRDGVNVLAELVPAIIHLTIEHPNEDWGEPCYPPIPE